MKKQKHNKKPKSKRSSQSASTASAVSVLFATTAVLCSRSSSDNPFIPVVSGFAPHSPSIITTPPLNPHPSRTLHQSHSSNRRSTHVVRRKIHNKESRNNTIWTTASSSQYRDNSNGNAASASSVSRSNSRSDLLGRVPTQLQYRSTQRDAEDAAADDSNSIISEEQQVQHDRAKTDLDHQHRQQRASQQSNVNVNAAVERSGSQPQHQYQRSRASRQKARHGQLQVVHQQNPNHQVSSILHTLWTRGKSKRALEQAKQDKIERENEHTHQTVLDDYLESIDRRYKRLRSHGHNQEVVGSSGSRHRSSNANANAISNSSHSRSQARTRSGTTHPVSSAWQFLIQASTNRDASVATAVEEQRKQEDAIYVLGLANLASKRLLQRHHLPIPESVSSSDSSSSAIIDIQQVPMQMPVPVPVSVPVVQSVQTQTQSQTHEQTMSLTAQPSSEANLHRNTNTNMNTNLPTPVQFTLELLKHMQSAYMQRVTTLSLKAQTYAKSMIRMAYKAFSALFATAARGSGGKYALHVVGLFLAGMAGFLKPIMTKA